MALSNKSSKLIDKQPSHVRAFQKNGKTYWVDGTRFENNKWEMSIREENGRKWWWVNYFS